MSPKGDNPLVVTGGDELKLVHPRPASPERFARLDFAHFFLQPMDTAPGGPAGDVTPDTLAETVAYCLAHPQWRLSLQAHKIAGVD